MAKNNNLGDFLTDIANAIRTKKGTSGSILAQDFSSEILNIPVGMTYEDYARTFYLAWGQSRIFPNAWEHSLEVDISEIEKNSTSSIQYGRMQYPDGEVEGVIIPDSVTRIGQYAFSDWSSNNQPLVIPNTITRIELRCFSGWSSNNQPLVIPNTITRIGGRAFQNWSVNNHPLVIPNSVANIDEGAFYGWRQVPYIEMQSITPPSLGTSVFNTQNNAPIYVPDESVEAYRGAANWSALAGRIFSINEK